MVNADITAKQAFPQLQAGGLKRWELFDSDLIAELENFEVANPLGSLSASFFLQTSRIPIQYIVFHVISQAQKPMIGFIGLCVQLVTVSDCVSLSVLVLPIAKPAAGDRQTYVD